ncbi:peptidase, partial [Escherichia coli]
MSTVYHRPAAPSGDDSYVRPLFADRCQAGFPSPATDYAEQELDLNSYCISRPAATFFLRASGESMNQAGVQNGDLLVVDRAEKPQHGDIVIAEID